MWAISAIDATLWTIKVRKVGRTLQHGVDRKEMKNIISHTLLLPLFENFILACTTLIRLRWHDRSQPSSRRIPAVAYGGEGYKRRGEGAQSRWKSIGSRWANIGKVS